MTTPSESMGSGRVVFWDFDGTLAYRFGMWRGCLVSALGRVDPSHALTHDAVGRGLQSGFPWHEPERGHLEMSTTELWWGALLPLFVRAYEQAGVSASTAAQAAALVAEVYVDPTHWAVFDDVRPALERLRNGGGGMSC
jgi:putative hydrolase of the HAD superfamily